MKIVKISKVLLLSAASVGLCQSIYAQTGAHAIMGQPAPGYARSHAWAAPFASPFASPSVTVVHGPGQSCGVSQGNVCYYNPVDFNTAYFRNYIQNNQGGAGITVAIVDAFYNSQTAADLATFSTNFGLPAPNITIVSQTGTVCPTGCTSSSTFDAEGWALETDLDVEAVHSIAPNANILLVTATSDSLANLYTADVYAYNHADVVTNSWGAGEFSGETFGESIFAASTVPLLFSSGDTGAVPEYPCMSAYTVCVGGTKLLLTPTSFRNIESAWGTDSGGGGGGGCSLYITAPAFQSGFSTGDCGTFRGAPDISADADEYTGMNTYLGAFAALGLSPSCTPALCPPGGYVIGGTSLASPLMAGLIANIDADRVFNGKSKLGSGTNLSLYAAGSVSYHYHYYDVTTGSTGNPAAPGWDDATGLGVILGPSLAFYLLTLP